MFVASSQASLLANMRIENTPENDRFNVIVAVAFPDSIICVNMLKLFM